MIFTLIEGEASPAKSIKAGAVYITSFKPLAPVNVMKSSLNFPS
jgi:hypothetical protein